MIRYLALAVVLMGCGGDNHEAIRDVSGESGAVPACYFHQSLAFVNTPSTSAEILSYAGVHGRAAESIEYTKAGNDGIIGTVDDFVFTSLEQIDALSYVGPAAIDALLGHASLSCNPALRLTGIECSKYEATQMASADWADIDTLVALGLPKASSAALVSHRAGADGVNGTPDDVAFISMKHIDSVSGVGDKTIDALINAGVEICGATDAVVFSPQRYEDSHLKRVELAIDNASNSIDIAMYSFRDTAIFNALTRAVQRGVRVRVMYEAASAHRKDPKGTMSADLEDAGIEVRWVNKIMHHKFAIVDGPQKSLHIGDSFRLITGSGNWSYSAGTKYDENTLFISGDERLALSFQAEFNLLWENGRPVLWNESIPSISHVDIESRDVSAAVGADAFFTSDNFRAYVSSTYGPTFTADGPSDSVVSEVVALIDSAESSIRIASGHMRSRPILDAILRKSEQSPSINISVYLDGQEYISEWYYEHQIEDLEECLADAGTDTGRREECRSKGYYFSYDLVASGIPTRFKFYSYRWHYSYAEQMHHKYLIIDDRYLLTGSYNFSNNAEENTFENMILLDATTHPVLVSAYRRNHESMWHANRSALEPLMQDITAGEGDIPLVFGAMALEWQEVSRVKNGIREACARINDASFREHPEKHKVCARN